MSRNAVVLSNLTRVFGNQKALDNVSLTLPKRGLVAFLGPSGCGKSTLLNILSGVDEDYEGEACVLGEEMRSLSKGKRGDFRLRNIGYVFQNFGLLELETAENNVLLVLDALYGDRRLLKKKKAHDLLSFFGMDKKARVRANALSGGEKQRVALARSLAADPKIVLADEPTGALDEKNARHVFSLLRGMAKKRLVVVVTHDEALAKDYADRIFRLADGRLLSQKENTPKEGRFPAPKSLVLHRKRKSFRLSLSFLFGHSFRLMKSRKWRAILSEGTIAMALSCLGLAVYVSSSIGTELRDAFSSLIPPNSIVMGSRGGNTSPIGSIYRADFVECEYAVEEYGEMIVDYGSDLHMDYEAWFKDANSFYYLSGVERCRLEDLSIRSINDFQWLDLRKGIMVYPRMPAITYSDQLVLGLPYENMFRLCLNLHIQRNYQALGEYIDSHRMDLVLQIANYDYGFDDEERFEVLGVVESPVPCFYHLDHRWNRKIIVDQLCFHPYESEDTVTPQDVFEIPYLALSVPPSDFLRLAREDVNLEHLVFEPASHAYVPSICSVGESCDLGRLYVYGAEKSGVGFPWLNQCMKSHPEIRGRLPVTQGSYYAEPGSLALGFVGKFFLCQNEGIAEEMVDFYSDLPLNSAFLPGEKREGSLDGSYLSSSGGIQLSADVYEPSYGRPPSSPEECLLSEELYQRWGEPSYVFVAVETGAEEVGPRYQREMKVSSLKVTGTKKGSRDLLYVPSDWTVDYFVDALAMSSFLLEPYGCVFFLQEGVDAGALVESLSKEYPLYAFSSPAEEVSSSIETTLSYVSSILSVFSLVALGMSALLFLIVLAITLNENLPEARVMERLGIRRSRIAGSFRATCLLYVLFAFASASILLLLAEVGVKLFIANQFGSSPSFGIPVEPFIAVFGSGIALSLLLMLGISINLLQKMAKKC